MSNIQHASLVLSSASSVANDSRTSFTWSNIDLRMLLGDMYNKYDRYNLCLNTIVQGLGGDNANNFFNAQIDAQVLIRISGLPWINNSYNITSTGSNNSPYTIISGFKFLNNTQQVEYLHGSSLSTFGKSQDLASITIDYIRMSDLVAPVMTVGHPYPPMSFIFDIYGIDDYKINQVEQRIIR